MADPHDAGGVPRPDPPDGRVAALEERLERLEGQLHDLTVAYLFTNLSLAEYVRKSGTDVEIAFGPDQKMFRRRLDDYFQAVSRSWDDEDGD